MVFLLGTSKEKLASHQPFIAYTGEKVAFFVAMAPEVRLIHCKQNTVVTQEIPQISYKPNERPDYLLIRFLSEQELVFGTV